ncbi:hypothetical protein BJX68DRAFT_273168 [Aspergillus pseudodeflectus]|uniref:Receptor L-domain domain-containing protein n=1 Tax=Aspergillus pseudodeflectus TaxID=176178 RepID=A0ABR4JAX3_9EURO
MVQLKFLVALLSAVVTLPFGSTARECYVDGTDKGRFNSLLVKTYPQLNQFKGCTTLIGSLNIGPTFAGDLSLRGVKNITGSISVVGAVEEIDLPDLEYIGEVILFERHRVKRLLLPKVTRVKGLHMSQPRGFFFNLGALRSAEAISLEGPWSRVSFPSLENVELELSFGTELSWASKGYPRDPAPIDIELPALRRVDSLNLTHLLNAESMTIESNIPTECSDHVVWIYRYLNRPHEAAFCDERSLFRAGRNTWPDLYRPTPSYEPTPTPPPYTNTTPKSTPSPSPSPSPGTSPRAGLGSGAEVVIVAAFGMVLSVSIIWFCMSRRKGSIELEDEYEKEKGPMLSKAEMEAAEEEEMDRLLHGEFEDDALDAPPPYAKHVRG